MNNFPNPGTFAEKATAYYLNLRVPDPLPGSVEVMNPYQETVVESLVRQFYQRFFDDQNSRVFLFGINPGRFGGGLTGIAFTDPVALSQYCGIPNDLRKTSELSSRFVYRFIEALGGPSVFYRHFYLTALYPLALVKDGKNYNFYDAPALYAALKPAIVANLRAQLAFGAENRAICLGRKNGEYLQRLNEEYRFFESIAVLDHPRYIMQYKTKQVAQYVEQYVRVLS